MRVTIASVAALLLCSPVLAADIYLPTPMQAQPAVAMGNAASLKVWGAYGIPSSDDSDFQQGYGDFGFQGRVAHGAWMFDGFGEFHSSANPDDANTPWGVGLIAHRLFRDGDRTLGIFGGGVGGIMYDYPDENVVHLVGGLEGVRKTSADDAIFWQVGFQGAVGGNSIEYSWEHGALARAGWRHYVNDDAKVELELSGAIGRFDGDFGGLVAWGASYEHRLNGGPFALGGFYRGTYFTVGGSSDTVLDNVFGVALTLDMNTMSIRDRDEKLPFDFPAPMYQRAFSWGDTVN